MRNPVRQWLRNRQTTPQTVRWIDTKPVKSTDVPCTIQSLDVRADVYGLYAEVTQTLVIDNPNRRDLSVAITIPLPDRAVVCGYALDIDGRMVDGVVVPQEQARVAFETEQRRGADPGLVEAVRGNVYRTRVYPVPAQGARTLRLTYVAPLLVTNGTTAKLDLPMPTEPLAQRTVRIDVALLDCPAPVVQGLNDPIFTDARQLWSIEAAERDLTASSHVRVSLPELPTSFALVQKEDEGNVWFCVSQLAPEAEWNVPSIEELTVLWDISGSRAETDHAAEIELLRAYCSMATLTTFNLVTFSNHAEQPCTFSTPRELIACIEALTYDGGSNFEELGRVVGDLCSASTQKGARGAFVLFTDGMDTLSDTAVTFPSTCHLMAIASGTARDMESLRQACRGSVFDLAMAPHDAKAFAQELFCPRRLRSFQSEGTADVLGIGSGSDGRYTLIGRLSEAHASLLLEHGDRPFDLVDQDARVGTTLAHAWAAQRVAQLSPHANDNAEELLALGRRFGVVSPATSLLVLETLDQWLRYEIEPPATWPEMHQRWVEAQEGIMRVTSEEGRKQSHLRQLRQSWRELLAWWERDDFTPDPPLDVTRDEFHAQIMGAPVRREAAAPMGGRMRGPARSMARESSSAMDTAMFCAFAEEDACAMPDAMTEAPASAAPAATPKRTADISVSVKPWTPNTPYLNTLDRAFKSGMDAAHKAYFSLRPEHASSPSFFLDCAGWFMAHDDNAFGLRVLTNLAELRIEDPALLRVLAWRLREAGELDLALVTLRRVLRLRSEDSQSHRDVALVLSELARRSLAEGNESLAKAYTEEAGQLYRKTALTPWQRRPLAIGLFAVEEYNVLRAWISDHVWSEVPDLPSLDPELEGVLDCDLRITLAWDADETDVDLHVTEPSGEEAYYGHRLTSSGGRVSEDITDGYGPELYHIRKAKDGTYRIRAHYYASHQQAIFGPATCTLTVYTNWGRPSQRQQITSTRLSDQKEMITVGSASYGDPARSERPSAPLPSVSASPSIHRGMTAADLASTYGTPDQSKEGEVISVLTWNLPGGRMREAVLSEGKLERLVERMPWGEEMIVI